MYYGYRLWSDGNCIHEDVSDTQYEDYDEAYEEAKKYAEETVTEWNSERDEDYPAYTLDDIEIEIVSVDQY